MEIKPITGKQLNLPTLLEASLAERFEFVQRLLDEYNSGRNRFDRPGEILFSVWDDGQIVGVGGLNRDPYLPHLSAGRVRHVYILPAYRRCGAGRLLMDAIIDHGRRHFELLTLRTLTADAAAFYVALGFESASEQPSATHLLRFAE